MPIRILYFVPALLILAACKGTNSGESEMSKDSAISCMQMPARFSQARDTALGVPQAGDTSGMVLIPGGTFIMGGNNSQAVPDEFPRHKVTLAPFYLDKTEVTNAQFSKFVEATGYITLAEKKPDWEELKKSLPPGTPKPHDSLLIPASLVFRTTNGPVDLRNFNEWWTWKSGANWRQPRGPGSNIIGHENYPVVHISWYDAMAYCKWAGTRLPTEAEWEWAARGGLTDNVYPWGNEHVNAGLPKANSWEGTFPYLNIQLDGHLRAGPVKTYSPNGYGLYDMAGNVWEWCSDWYDEKYYLSLKDQHSVNPAGPSKSYDPEDPYTPKKSLRGGSFLCNDSYCSGYRVSRRMKSSPDTGLEHTGFRCARDVK